MTPDDTLEMRLENVRKREHVKGLRKREWIVLGVFLILALLALVNFKRVVVSGVSMEPTLHQGQTLVVWKTAPRKNLKIGDMIVFRADDGDELVKRIAAVRQPGQPLRFPDSILLASGKRLLVAAWFTPRLSPYVLGQVMGHMPPPRPDQTLYVMGDNQLNSSDSRDFGPISPNQILGKVIP